MRALDPERGTEHGRSGNGYDAGPDPLESAREAGLLYVSDDRPGIRRRRADQGFRYLRPDGSPVQDEPTLRRIRSLVIPPAWTDVWIAIDPRGHIQADRPRREGPQAVPLPPALAGRPR
jgi:DNA topoisomerase-1